MMTRRQVEWNFELQRRCDQRVQAWHTRWLDQHDFRTPKARWCVFMMSLWANQRRKYQRKVNA